MMMARAVGGAHSPDVLRVLSDSSPSSAGSSFRELDDVFLQTQARIWLGEVLHTRLDEETAIADILADGKLLFQVSRVIWKMLLTKCMELRYSKAYIYEPKISGKCSGRYMPYSNVDSFLKVCQILGLTGVDLFSPSDVVEKRDIRRVCMCIRSLSKKARSKHFIVPDFDIVTYTIAMPTDMVGCIRRSLEQSQRSASSSRGGNPYINSKVKYRQNEDYSRSYDSYSEGSDDAESDFRIFGFHSPDSNASDTVNLLFPDLEKSLGISEFAENCFLTESVLLSDTKDQEVDRYNSQYGPVCVMASMDSLNTNHRRNVNPEFFSTHHDAILNHLCIESQNDLNAGELYINRKEVGHPMCTLQNSSMSFCNITTPASVVGDSIDANTSEGSYAGLQSDIPELNGHRTDSGDYVLSDKEGKDRIFMIDNRSSSNRGASKYVIGRRLSDETEDAEVSTTASLNSVSSKVVTVDYEDGIEAELDFTNVKIDSPKFQGLEIDQMDVRPVSGPKFYDIVECQSPEDLVTPEADRPQGNLKCVNSMNSTFAFQPTADWKRLFTMGDQNHVETHACGIMYGRDSAVAPADDNLLSNFNATLNSENVSSNMNRKQLDQFLSSQSVTPSSIQALWNEKDRCLMTTVSNEGNSVAAPSELVMPHGLYTNLVCHSPTKASGDALQLDNSKSIVVVNTNEIYTASKSGADIDTRKHPSISLSTTCFGKDTEVSCEALSVGSTVARNEVNLEVLEVQNCNKYLFVENNLNCSLKPMFRDGVGCKNNSEEKIVLNRFSTLTGGEEMEPTSPLSLETSCFPQVNPSGITIGADNEKIVLNGRNSISNAIWCHRSSLFDDIATPDLMIHPQDLDVNIDRHIQPVCGDSQNAESDSYKLKIERMGSPVEVRDACSKLSDGLGIRNIGHQETQTTIRVLVDEHAVHTSDVPGSQSMLTLDNQPYSSVACLEETSKEENSEHLLETTLQVFHEACINCDKEVDYCTKHMDEGKGKHGKVKLRTVECPKVSECKPGKKLLLRSIAGGVTLFGGILIFLHFRRKGSREKIGDTIVPSTQSCKAGSPELSTKKAPKRDGTNRVYPGDRIRFQD